jgi:hypothetical protein
MAVPTWPTAVRHQQARNNAGVPQPRQDALVSETEAGAGLTRKRPGPKQSEIAWRSLEWTGAEYLAFETFYEVSLIGGTIVFDMPVYKPGLGYVVRKCKLKGAKYSIDETISPYFIVSFTLIVFNW